MTNLNRMVDCDLPELFFDDIWDFDNTPNVSNLAPLGPNSDEFEYDDFEALLEKTLGNTADSNTVLCRDYIK